MQRQGAAVSLSSWAFVRMRSVAVLLSLSLAIGVSVEVSEAEAAGVRCKIPAALLCPGCAAAIRITVLGNGQCRVTFDTPAANSTAKTADLDVEVQIARPPRSAAGPLDRRLRAAKRLRLQRIARLRPVVAPISGPRCFEFSGRRYCE